MSKIFTFIFSTILSVAPLMANAQDGYARIMAIKFANTLQALYKLRYMTFTQCYYGSQA